MKNMKPMKIGTVRVRGKIFRVSVVMSLGGPLAVVIGDEVLVVGSGDRAADKRHAAVVAKAVKKARRQ
jgi:hypothetical protein